MDNNLNLTVYLDIKEIILSKWNIQFNKNNNITWIKKKKYKKKLKNQEKKLINNNLGVHNIYQIMKIKKTLIIYWQIAPKKKIDIKK